MNILNKFTLKSLSKNKKRTIVTIIGVALSAALICAVAGMFMSLQKTLIETEKQMTGNFHLRFDNVPTEELKYIENNKNINGFFYSSSLGYSLLENCQNEDKPYLYVLGLDDEALKNSGLTLIEGRMPQNENEIVLSNHMITNGKVKFDIGDTITLNIGKRVNQEGYELDQSNPYYSQDNSYETYNAETGEKLDSGFNEKSIEEIIDTKSKTYKVVGYIDRPSYIMESYSSPGYTAITHLTKDQILDQEDVNISVFLSNPKNRDEKEKFKESVINSIEKDTGTTIHVTENSDLLRFEGNLSNNSLVAIYSIAGIVIAIIVVSSAFVIRNSFSISVSEKTKQYGMMASVGATSKQVRKSVLFEALFIGLIGIPIGILCGIIAIVVLIWLLNTLLQGIETIEFVYALPVEAILITVAMSGITIFLSAIIPAIRASKITPIEAIRESKDIKIKAKKIKTSKLTKKIFGIGGVIAAKNLKRSRKKYRTTVVSLVVSITIFIALSSFLQDGMKMTGYYYDEQNYNVEIYKNINSNVLYLSEENTEESRQNNEKNNKAQKETFEKIVKEFNLTDYCYSYYYGGAKINIEKYGSKDGKDYYHSTESDDALKNINIIKLEKNYFSRYLKELGIKETKDTAILTDEFMYGTQDNPNRVIRLYNIQDGDNINITTGDGEKSLTITKVTNEMPMGYYRSSSIGHIFISEENDLVSNDMCSIDSLRVNSEEPNKLESELLDRKMEDENYSDIIINNYEANAEAEKRIILIVSIFLYGFITVITLIGVTNIFNTITTNMILRSKEFAMLKSIGMTKKEFNRMIFLESIMYGAKSLVIGVPLGIGLSYAIYRSYAQSIEFGYVIPTVPILISVVFVFIIVGLTMRYSLSKINKQNIVETIRNDNI